jgi:hypothetical protein
VNLDDQAWMRFAADENFDGRILDGLLVRLPTLNILRVQDTEMYQLSDPELLDRLAHESRILLTHDARTIPAFVYERVRAGLPVPGVIEVNRSTQIGQAIVELEVMIGAGRPDEFVNQVRYIPLVLQRHLRWI